VHIGYLTFSLKETDIPLEILNVGCVLPPTELRGSRWNYVFQNNRTVTDIYLFMFQQHPKCFKLSEFGSNL